MKHLITSTLLLFSTQAIAGGSETNPFLEAINFNGHVIMISNPIITIYPDKDIDGGDGGVETKPTIPKPIFDPISKCIQNACTNDGEFEWPILVNPDGFNASPEGSDSKCILGGSDDKCFFDGGNDGWSIINKGGSETITAPVKWSSYASPLELKSIRYFGSYDESVVLQVNQENQFIKLEDHEISKFQKLSDLIQESANKKSAWVKID